MRGGPSDDEHRTIVEALERGHFPETAAALAGVTTAQMRRWLRLGADPEHDLHGFACDAHRAMAESEDAALKVLLADAEPKSIMWWLERRHPAKWGAKVQHVVRGEVDGILERIESLEGELGADTIDRVLAAIAGEWGAGSGDPEEATGEGLH